MNFTSSSPLLDATESVLKARPLRSWSSKQKDALRSRFAALHGDWSGEWMPPREATPEVPAVEVVEPDGAVVLPSDNSACWAFVAPSRRGTAGAGRGPLLSEGRDGSSAALQAIGDRMFSFDMASALAGPVTPAIAPAIVRAAWMDWLQRTGALLSGFGLLPQQFKGVAGNGQGSDLWSGALLVRWAWCGGVWSLGLPFDAIATLLGHDETATRSPTPMSQAPKERLDRALTELPVALRVMLDGTELNLGQLQELRLDDVVPLEHLLDSPALVVGADGTPICNGWLGQSEGRIAVELTAPTGTPSPRVKTAGRAPNAHTSKERKS